MAHQKTQKRIVASQGIDQPLNETRIDLRMKVACDLVTKDEDQQFCGEHIASADLEDTNDRHIFPECKAAPKDGDTSPETKWDQHRGCSAVGGATVAQVDAIPEKISFEGCVASGNFSGTCSVSDRSHSVSHRNAARTGVDVETVHFGCDVPPFFEEDGLSACPELHNNS